MGEKTSARLHRERTVRARGGFLRLLRYAQAYSIEPIRKNRA